MGIFDFLKKSQPKENVALINADELRKALFEAIDRNHLVEFETLCAENEQEVIDCFKSWKQAPDDIRLDKEAFRKYSYCLMVIASHFQKQRNNKSLMTLLTGLDDTEMTLRWQEELGQAQALMREIRLDEAAPILESCLDRSATLSGASVEKFLPMTLGSLGECYFHLAQLDKAQKKLEEALSCCKMQSDSEGILAYLYSLYELHRYAGNTEQAAQYCTELAEAHYERNELVNSSGWRHQEPIVRAGEPLHRAIIRIADELFELNEIPKIEGEKVEIVLVRNKMELYPCSKLCQDARNLIQENKTDEALALLSRASDFDKFSPQPIYLSAAINLASRNYSQAILDFEKVETLCPGYETSRSDIKLAQDLLENKMEHDACMAVFETNITSIPLENRINICKTLIEKYPKFGEAYYRCGRLFAESGDMEQANLIWQTGLEELEELEKQEALEKEKEPDLKSRLLAELARLTKDESTKRKLLLQAISINNGNILANAMSHFMLRQLDKE